MRTKNMSVNLDLCENLFNKLQIIESCCKFVEGDKYIMTITSANDGKHKYKSLHFVGKAIDIRNRDMQSSIDVSRYLRMTLGSDFDVINEKDHIHIEWDINNN